MKLTTSFEENLSHFNAAIKDCGDIKTRTMYLGNEANVKACIFYVEVAINNLTIEESVIGKLLSRLMDKSPEEIYEYLSQNALGITDVKELPTLEEALMGVMIGDGVIFIDGYDKAIKIKSKGYPMMGVSSSENEKVLCGSREGFVDSVKANTSLLRKRIRNNKLKVKEHIIGDLSKTTVALVYVDGLARASVLAEINNRIEKLMANTEGLTDSGIVEQLTSDYVFSPFPGYQTTERPDKAAITLMEGRVILRLFWLLHFLDYMLLFCYFTLLPYQKSWC